MKSFFLPLAVCLGLFNVVATSRSMAQGVSIERLAKAIENANLQFVDRGPYHGYVSTMSCLWRGQDILLVQHYCDLGKKFPAQSFSIFSAEFGQIQFYTESRGAFQVKDIRINTLAVDLAKFLPSDFSSLRIADMSAISEKVYLSWLPACWATNFSDGSPGFKFDCIKVSVEKFKFWGDEALQILQTDALWREYWKRMSRDRESV